MKKLTLILWAILMMVFSSQAQLNKEKIPLKTLKECHGDTLAFLRANFRWPPASYGGNIGSLKDFIETMKKELPIKSCRIDENEFGLSYLLFYIETPQEIQKKFEKGKTIPMICVIYYRPVEKNTEKTILEKIETNKIIKWQDKYIDFLNLIVPEYAILDKDWKENQ